MPARRREQIGRAGAPLAWKGRKVSVLSGGLKDGWWYFTDELEGYVARLGWQYEPTRRTRQHPDHEGVTGTVWVYIGEPTTRGRSR